MIDTTLAQSDSSEGVNHSESEKQYETNSEFIKKKASEIAAKKQPLKRKNSSAGKPSPNLRIDPMVTYPYRVTGPLGKGTYGVVYKAVDPNGNAVALKTISLENETEGVPSTALREISTMKEINHPNVLKLFHVLASPKALTVAFELADFDLKRYMDVYHYPLSSRRVKSYMYQLFQAIGHVHHLMILHRDIKPQNLLVFQNGLIKVADFGLSRAFSVPVREFAHEVVTLWYRPPDVLLGNQNYDTGVDMWSLGCVFAEMLQRHPLFPGSNPTDQLKKIFQILGTPDKTDMPNCKSFVDWKLMEDIPKYPRTNLADRITNATPDALDLLQKILVYDGKARISAAAALAHPYFTRSTFEVTIPLLPEHVKLGKVAQELTTDTTNPNQIAQKQAHATVDTTHSTNSTAALPVKTIVPRHHPPQAQAKTG